MDELSDDKSIDGKISLHDSTVEESSDFHSHDDREIIQETNWLREDPKIRVKDFMLVKFLTKKTVIYNIGKVEDIDSVVVSYNIQFMGKDKKEIFIFHWKMISVIEKNGIIIKLS